MADIDDVLVDGQGFSRLAKAELGRGSDVGAVTAVELCIEKAEARLVGLLQAWGRRLLDGAFLLHFAVVFILLTNNLIY